MKIILSDKIVRIVKNKKKLEKVLNLKISNRGKEVSIDGSAEDEYVGEKVIDALNFGFPFSAAVAIKKNNLEFQKINIKEHTHRKDMKSIRARLIGKAGKTLKVLSDLTECYVELKDNQMGVIGAPESMENSQNAIIAIIKGAKQTNVYSHLEKNRPEEIHDLGLRE